MTPAIELKTIMLLGTPDISAHIFDALYQAFPAPNTIVVSQPDKVRGRGKKTSPSPVKAWAESKSLETHTPTSKTKLDELVQSIQPDLIWIIAYGMILPASITDGFTCINVHASLLPKYRGPSPIQAALLNGDTETGITLMTINDKMDEGDMLHQVTIPIEPSDNFGSLIDKMATIGAETCVNYTRDHILTGTMTRTPQDHSKASICKLIKKEDLIIDTSQSPETILNQIRAHAPKPGAVLQHDNQAIKLLAAHIEDGNLVIDTLQPPGKGPMSYHDYCLGRSEIKL